MTSDQRKVCVVSLIGKSQFQSDRSKAWKLNSLIQKNVFKSDSKLKEKFLLKIKEASKKSAETDVKSKENEEILSSKSENPKIIDHNIQTYHDQKNRVIYVHLESIFDINNIYEHLIKNHANDDRKNFFEHWEAEQLKYLKSVLLIFSISHIVIISNPSCEMDITYIRFFRIIDSLRIKLMPSLVDLLKTLDLPIGKDWIHAARPCSPRVIFTFENCPRDLLNDSNSNQILEKFQHALEDQIYNSLRKSYVITNISNNSLFAIPANQEFVYVHRTSPEATRINKLLMLNGEFNKTSSTGATSLACRSIYSSSSSQTSQTQERSKSANATTNTTDLDAKLFREFVFRHIHTALEDGFNDNFGRTNPLPPIFELSTAENWYKVYESFRDFFLIETPKSSKIASYYSQLKSQIDLDVQFSENRCKKLLQPALGIYQENLPAHYNKNQHQQRLEKALSLYQTNARGPMYSHYLAQLKRDCSNLWQNGRQLCEAISLTGHNCILELHKVPGVSANESNSISTTVALDDEPIAIAEAESSTTIATTTSEKSEDETSSSHMSSQRRLIQSSDNESSKRGRNSRTTSGSVNRSGIITFPSGFSSELKVRPHTSNIATLAASNCGEFQRERKDPFELKEANYTFYEDFCQPEVANRQMLFIKYMFPVFKPSVLNAKPSEKRNQTIQTFPSAVSQSTQQQQQQELSVSANLSQDNNNNTNSKSPINLESAISQSAIAQADKPAQTQTLLTKPDEEAIKEDSVPISTEIYLTGMTHSDSPVGLLPRFSSWSLVSIGKYVEYNAHAGLTQPGFMPGHNFLIPWDLVVSNNTVTSLHDKPNSRKNLNQKTTAADFDSLSRQFKKTSISTAQNSVTVRAFIGVEYECPCGHRFICSGPDRLVKLTNSGVLKDDAYKLLNMDMPLYTACPCRNSKDSTPYMAQLMRVFVVTPPGNVRSDDLSTNGTFLNISIRPRVQPNPAPCPAFWPSQNDPIVLADDSVWVLRLPYIYMSDDEKPYSMPTDFETLNNCKVLKGMFSVALTSLN